MDLKLEPAMIKCQECKQRSLIRLWKVGSDDGNLIRVCPLCGNKEIV